jgi:pyrimidine deaminase RibD-like protein
MCNTGYSRELPGNTHAEECALAKLEVPDGSPTAEQVRELRTRSFVLAPKHTADLSFKRLIANAVDISHLTFLPHLHAYRCHVTLIPCPMQPEVYMYTTMEPCSKRVSGNSPCVARILATRDYGNSRAGCKVTRVYVGAMEPSNFVNCEGM